ncbi:MAG: ParB/RepB/Spo0J family partition protein [Clostridia bacterium]
MNKTGLGKGLGALIETESTDNNGIVELKINEIEPNINQPRKRFDDDKLKQLSESIKQHGVVQPIICKKEDDAFRIIAGERRWRAARMAGIEKIPVIIKDLTSKEIMEIALIENLQREDLNPIEEAEAYDKLMGEFKMTQEEVSKTVGKSRSAIANSTRLLGLDNETKSYISNGQLSSGHARTLIPIADIEMRVKTARDIIDRDLNVRDTEKLVKRLLTKRSMTKQKEKDCDLIEIEDKLKNIFGTKVKLLPGNKKGKIVIEYYSNDDLDRILDIVERPKKKQ